MALESLATPPAQSSASPPAPSAQGDAPAAPVVASRPEWAPESYWDGEKNTLKPEFGKHYSELTAAQKAQADRLASLPQKPEDVKFTLPADFKLPEGVKLDDNDPMIAEARKIVVEDKLDPAAANKFYGLYVRKQLAERTALEGRIAGEMQKLGAAAQTRIAALRTFTEATVGKDGADALMKNLFTVGQVEALEKIMSKFSSQGGATPPARQFEQPTPPPKPVEQRWYPDQARKVS